MSANPVRQPSLTTALWRRWKALRLPWRTTYLVGQDLAGNTFWELKNKINPSRPRRMARYPSSTHLGDVKITPAWMQWLRHTRAEAPTISEQEQDLMRQDNLKTLAARADARWAEKESFLDKPQDTAQTQPLMQPRDRGGYVQATEDESRQGVKNAAGDIREVAGSIRGQDVDKGRFKGETKDKDSPWSRWEAQKKGAPSDSWQPESWNPGKATSR